MIKWELKRASVEREKRGFSKTISGRFASLFHRSSEEEGAGFGPDLSRPRRDGSYIRLRWVYLRTKWFLFGLRASCASHGGFVAAASRRRRRRRLGKDSETGQQEQRRATRWRRTSPPPSSPGLSQPSLLHSTRPSRVCVRVRATDRPT